MQIRRGSRKFFQRGGGGVGFQTSDLKFRQAKKKTKREVVSYGDKQVIFMRLFACTSLFLFFNIVSQRRGSCRGGGDCLGVLPQKNLSKPGSFSHIKYTIWHIKFVTWARFFLYRIKLCSDSLHNSIIFITKCSITMLILDQSLIFSKTGQKRKKKLCSFLNLVAKRAPFFERKIKNWWNNYALYFKEMKKMAYF